MVRLWSCEEKLKYTSEVAWGALWTEIPKRLVEQGLLKNWDEATKFMIRWTTDDAKMDPAWIYSIVKPPEKMGEFNAGRAMDVLLEGLVNDLFIQNINVIEEKPNRGIAEWTGCLTCESAKQKGILGEDKYRVWEMCDAWWRNAVKEMNPKLKSRYEKCMCKGDDRCRIVIED